MTRLRAALARIEDSRLGDALGAALLFGWIAALMLIAEGLS